jgi:DNA-binding beta-propeller fold protein YncE
LPWCVFLAAAALAVSLAGCDGSSNTMGHLEYVWGRQGVSDGRFQKPRAIAIDANDRIYVVDMTARIQVFDTQGRFLRAWQTPEHENGRPTGLSVGRDGRILVADTHYYRVLIYSPEGQLLQTLGGAQGQKPGQFGLVSDVVEDSEGNYYVSEYGEYDRIQKFTHEGRFILQWGGHGAEPGQFSRPQSMAIDENDRIFVADACNHRIQVFDRQGTLVKLWGGQGALPGKLYYPYGVALAPDGSVLVAEFGNHRVQRFTRDGRSTGCWGSQGRGAGQLYNPWGLVLDSQGRMHVLDTNNHRVQVVGM